ncbi:MAG TPA: FAD-dependent oxidoreductase [Candidatus Saccharimonadales bacterium]|nr:FAD-dependent oxidoreductase [Candidatus Saccharimonadales bacterium]
MQLLYKSIAWRSHNVATLSFAPLQKTSWIAGQSIKIEVPGTYGPLEHRFTISAHPHKGVIEITTRNSESSYKQKLFSLKPGTEVRAFAVDGDFTWRESTLPHIWVAAGIGITPFYAMATDRSHKRLPLNAHLIYSSRSDAVFGHELRQLARAHAGFSVQQQSSRPTLGQILALPNALQRVVYVSGPSAMVDEIGGSLLQAGLPQQQLVRDWFTGRPESLD